mgnify:CR=1 FL=1
MPFIQERMIEMEKAMLSSNCNHVQGDDISSFHVMIPDPDDIECGCNLVRAIVPGNNINVNVSGDKKSLVLSTPSNDIADPGRGVVSVDYRGTESPNRELFFMYSFPISIIDSSNNIINVQTPRISGRTNVEPMFNYDFSFEKGPKLILDNVEFTPAEIIALEHYVLKKSKKLPYARPIFEDSTLNYRDIRVYNDLTKGKIIYLANTAIDIYINEWRFHKEQTQHRNLGYTSVDHNSPSTNIIDYVCNQNIKEVSLRRNISGIYDLLQNKKSQKKFLKKIRFTH